MQKKAKKSWISIAAVLLALLLFMAPTVAAVSVSFDDIVSAAMTIIQQNEGGYGSVNSNDNGALSVGKVQWHGNRALSLLKTIVNANPTQAKNILGTALYQEITTASSWATRILTSDENSKISALLVTKEGIAAQDALEKADISTYVTHGMKLGITSPAALVYFADIENQCGGGGSARVAAAAAATVGGDYGKITLEVLHQAALNDGPAGSYPVRRKSTYSKVLLLGWDGADSMLDGRELWATSAALNVREQPGVSGKLVTTLSQGSAVFISQKVMIDGATWGKCDMGWLSLGYCTYASGSIPSQIFLNPNGGSFASNIGTNTVTGVDSSRGTNALIVFTPKYGTSTRTNQYGMEVIVDATGKVVSTDWHGNATIPTGGFVLSGHGTMSTWITNNIRAGFYVSYEPGYQRVSVYRTYDAYLAAQKTAGINQAIGDLPTPEREGYLFEGWYTAASGGTQITEKTIYTSRTCTAYYAHWKEIPDGTVVWNTEGGVIDGLAQQAINGIDIWRAENYLVIYTNDRGETTATNAYGAEAVVNASGQVVELSSWGGNSTIPEGGFVVSGHGTMLTWIVGNISVGDYVAYDSVHMQLLVCKSQDVYQQAVKKLPAGTALGVMPVPTRLGHAFQGWYTEAGVLVTENTLMPEDGLVLHASWLKITDTLTFDAGIGSGAPESITFDRGQTVQIPDIVPDGGCYTFLGWSADGVDGEVQYLPGAAYSGGSTVLYAVYDMTHEMTEFCSITDVQPLDDGTCRYTYVCELCGGTRSFLRTAEEVQTDVHIEETLNGSYLRVQMDLSGTALLDSWEMVLEYDPTLMQFARSGANTSEFRYEQWEENGTGYIRLWIKGPFAGDGNTLYVYFTGVDTSRMQEHYLKITQIAGMLTEGLPGAFSTVQTTQIGSEPIRGDVNGDGILSPADAMHLQKFLVGLMPELPYPDVDNDGQYTPGDLLLLLKIIVHLA